MVLAIYYNPTYWKDVLSGNMCPNGKILMTFDSIGPCPLCIQLHPEEPTGQPILPVLGQGRYCSSEGKLPFWADST